MQPSSQPLNSDHLAILNNVLQSIPTTQDLIGKCKQCGLDVEQAEQMTNAAHTLATNLKRVFFPTAS
jgi:hypothetical protein